MPTAGKLFGAIFFGILAYFISDLVKPLLTEGLQVGWLSPVDGLIGVVIGWRLMGKGVRNGYFQALGYGVTTVVATAFWCIFIWSGHEMLNNSTRLRYDGPTQALQDMAQIYVDYMRLIAVPEILLPALVGSLFCGWVTEHFARRWS